MAGAQLLLLRLGPAPGVEDVVAGRPVLEQVEVRGGDGQPAASLVRVVRGAERTIRMEDAPDVADAPPGRDDAVGEGAGEHVEVAQGGDQVARLHGGADELGHLPGLGGAVADVGVPGALLVGGVGVGVEDLEDVPGPWAEADGRAGDALPDVPVAPPEGRGTAVELVGDHGGGGDGPAAEDGEASTKGTAVVELGVREDRARLPA